LAVRISSACTASASRPTAGHGLADEEVEDLDFDGGIYPVDLLRKDGIKEKLAKNGVKAPEDMLKKLFG
jgi:hypothetical protein